MSSGLRKVFGMGGTKELPMIRVSGVGLQVSVSDQGGGAFVSKIRCCSPAAFSGEIALGDNILTVDGLPASVKGNNASTAEWLTSSLDGEEGTPVWLLVANSNFAEPWQVRMVRQAKFELLEVQTSSVGLELAMCDGGFEIKSIVHGGPAWIVSERRNADARAEAPVVGDVIVGVDGMPVVGQCLAHVEVQLEGQSFTRVSLDLRRGAKELKFQLVRAPTLDEDGLKLFSSHRLDVLRLPSVPPSQRNNRRKQKPEAPPVAGKQLEQATAHVMMMAGVEDVDVDGDAGWRDEDNDEDDQDEELGDLHTVTGASEEARWLAGAACCCIMGKMASQHLDVKHREEIAGGGEETPVVQGDGDEARAGAGGGSDRDGTKSEALDGTSEARVSSGGQGRKTVKTQPWNVHEAGDSGGAGEGKSKEAEVGKEGGGGGGKSKEAEVGKECGGGGGKSKEAEVGKEGGGQAGSRAAAKKPSTAGSLLQAAGKGVSAAFSPLGGKAKPSATNKDGKKEVEVKEVKDGTRDKEDKEVNEEKEEVAVGVKEEEMHEFTIGWYTGKAKRLCTRMGVATGKRGALMQMIRESVVNDEGVYIQLILDKAREEGHPSDADKRGQELEGAGGGAAAAECDKQQDKGKAWLASGLPWTICWMVLASCIAKRRYDARDRAMIRRLAQHLGVPWQWISVAEANFHNEVVAKVAAEVAAQVDQGGPGSEQAAVAKKGIKGYLRYATIAGGAVVGGTVIGLTGGMATPAVLAGLGFAAAHGVGAGIVATVAGFGGLSAAVGVSFGAVGAGLVGYKVVKLTSQVKEFRFEIIDRSPGLPITIGVAGWLTGAEETCFDVWDDPLCDVASDGGECLALVWEQDALRDLGNSNALFVKSQVYSQARDAIGNAALGVAFSTLTWPLTLISLADAIDGPWSIAMNRADKAGAVLAQVLSQRVHGHRPVTLIGYGMGARVIITALVELAKMGKVGHGIVETAVCLGTPYSASSHLWEQASTVVSHRLINGYSEKDWILAFVFRSSSFSSISVAGLQPIVKTNPSNAVLENMDLTSVVGGHFAYREKLSLLVQLIGISSGVSLPAPPSSTPDTNAPKSTLASSVSAKLSFVFQNPLAPLARASSPESQNETDAQEDASLQQQNEQTCPDKQAAASSGGIMSMVANILSPRQQMEAKDREEGGGKGREGAVSSDGDGGTTGAACGGVSLDGQEDGDCPFDQFARETSSLFEDARGDTDSPAILKSPEKDCHL